MDYYPPDAWTTIRLMLVLECILGLYSKQGDITCAFLRASLGKDEAVYIEMPQGFKQYDKKGKPKVLKLTKHFMVYVNLHAPSGCISPNS